MLATEDDCLGIDFSSDASAFDQILWPHTAAGNEKGVTRTAYASFEASLRSLTRDECMQVLSNPGGLVWLYTSALTLAFSCHLELYRREWSALYEPYANTSVAYGYASHRNNVRKLTKEYSLHLRYVNSSLDSMRRLLLRGASNTRDDQSCTSNLEALVADFEYFARELESLKATCDNFLEQQVSKMSLQEARISMHEAKDLKRLSYLGFIFVPLSLASSFFSMNIVELGGHAPLWVFIVTSLGVLAFSIFIMILLSSARVGAAWKSFIVGAQEFWGNRFVAIGVSVGKKFGALIGRHPPESEGEGLPFTQSPIPSPIPSMPHSPSALEAPSFHKPEDQRMPRRHAKRGNTQCSWRKSQVATSKERTTSYKVLDKALTQNPDERQSPPENAELIALGCTSLQARIMRTHQAMSPLA